MTEDAKTGRNAIEESGKLIKKKKLECFFKAQVSLHFWNLVSLYWLLFVFSFRFFALNLIFLGICASCRKTLRLLTAEEKESTVIASSTPRSVDASVLMQMENFNQVSFDPREDIYSQLALRHSVKYQATHTMQVFPIQLVCLYKVRGKWWLITPHFFVSKCVERLAGSRGFLLGLVTGN